MAEASVLLVGVSRLGFWKCVLLVTPANLLLSGLFAYAGNLGAEKMHGPAIFLASAALPGILIWCTDRAGSAQASR